MNRITVTSSNIRSIGYDEPSQTLEVEFNNGGLYSYPNFPKETYDEFMAASSHGGFFASEIKYNYAFKKLR